MTLFVAYGGVLLGFITAALAILGGLPVLSTVAGVMGSASAALVAWFVVALVKELVIDPVVRSR